MPKHKRILCPVDLSENSLGAIELATTLAKQLDSKITFCYVASVWEPTGSIELHEYAAQIIEENKTALYKIRPADSSVDFEHCLVHGNPGPALVTETKTADTVVMSTHGRGGIARLIMGSVANYLLRYAKCPVILVKGMGVAKDDSNDLSASNDSDRSDESQIYVTEVMHPVPPVRAFETMKSTLSGLEKARETAAPVVDRSGKCIGILTATDIDQFNSLQQRLDKKDETVIDEMFEVDKFGQRRPKDYHFDQVESHMTKEVISLQTTDSVQTAIELFEANPNIHHLVVLDEDGHASGIVDVQNVAGIGVFSSEKSTS